MENLLERETIILKSLGFQERKQNVIKVEKLTPNIGKDIHTNKKQARQWEAKFVKPRAAHR